MVPVNARAITDWLGEFLGKGAGPDMLSATATAQVENRSVRSLPSMDDTVKFKCLRSGVEPFGQIFKECAAAASESTYERLEFARFVNWLRWRFESGQDDAQSTMSSAEAAAALAQGAPADRYFIALSVLSIHMGSVPELEVAELQDLLREIGERMPVLVVAAKDPNPNPNPNL